MMTDDERRAFNAAMSAYWDSTDDGTSPGEAGFAAGIAYAQKKIAQARADALEEAANVCDPFVMNRIGICIALSGKPANAIHMEAARWCAAAIRARKDGQ